MIAPQPATAQRTILSLNNIEVVYNHVVLVLKGVSLKVPAGGIVSLLGANGAGKTTTLKAISNLLHGERGAVTKGNILFEGEEIQSLSPNEMVRRGCIQVMEGRHCFGHLTIEENLLTGAFTRRDGNRAIAADLELVYSYFPRLKDRRTSQAGYTSGGEQQMCAIGRALMSRPKMILLDEPSMGLAPQLVEEIFEIVDNLNAEPGRLLPPGRTEHQHRAALRHIRLHPRIRPHRDGRGCQRAQPERGRKRILSRDQRRRPQIVPRRQALQTAQALARLRFGPGVRATRYY